MSLPCVATLPIAIEWPELQASSDDQPKEHSSWTRTSAEAILESLYRVLCPSLNTPIAGGSCKGTVHGLGTTGLWALWGA